MVDFQESSQLHAWLYGKPEYVSWCRQKANYTARKELAEASAAADDSTAQPDPRDPTEASFEARGWLKRYKEGQEKAEDYERFGQDGPWENAKGKAFLNAEEEATLVAFYAPKLATLVGPKPAVQRLRRESKVTATAALLFRRFFLSNSVMLYDPKSIMVAAAFLASKVEDASADIRHLEEATQRMAAHVPQDEILAAELALIQGVAFDLLCFHPYKTILALTEDLRTFLKTDKGKALVAGRPVSGQDLEPMYKEAKKKLEDVILWSDLALLFTPGQIGLASLMVAQDILHEQAAQEGTASSSSSPLEIDWHGYVQHRFESAPAKEATWQALQELRTLMRQITTTTDISALKGIHKKLKKVRVWGAASASSSSEAKKRKKNEDGTEEKPAKRVKTEATA